MPRKPKEVEQEIDVSSVPEKKETFVTRWFREHAVDNKTELRYVCDLTRRSAEEQFKLLVKSENAEVFAVTFYVTFLSILEFIRSKQKAYNNFTIQMFNSVNLGYTNNDDEDNEKVGNFMPIMEYISINRTIVDDEYTDYRAKDNKNLTKKEIQQLMEDRFVKWKQTNAKQQVDYIKEIEHNAFNMLENKFKLSLRTEEAVIPLFCIFMDNISNVIRMKYRELKDTDVSEVSMNVLGLFDIYYSFNEDDGEEILDFVPGITMKLALKSDDTAARE